MINFKKAIPRRALLKGLGGTLALPLLDSMVPAFAGPTDIVAKPVIRMGIVYVPNGIIMNKWSPKTEGAAFEITPTLEALAPYRDRVLMLSGLDQKAAYLLGDTAGVHTRPNAAYLTGVHPKPTLGADIQLGISMDQVAAKELGKHTQLASLETCLDPVIAEGGCENEYSCAYMNTISWRSATTPMPMEDNPRVIFERLFGDAETTDRTTRLRLAKENRSLLDSFAESVADMRGKIGPGDRGKLTEYLDAVRDVERRLQLAEEQASRELPTLDRPGDSVPPSLDEYAKLMFDLQVLAYQTDMTRVITMALAHERSSRGYPQIGVPDGHHGLSHHRGDPENIAKLAKINAYHIKLFSYYVDRLHATPDGDGSLLDHVMILYGAGISDGNSHSVENLPVLLVGGGAGKIKSGRHIRYPQGSLITNLHMTMLDVMGTPIEKLGNSTGKLGQLSIA